MVKKRGKGGGEPGVSDEQAAFRTTFGNRLAAVLDLFATRDEAAKVARVSANQLQRYVRTDGAIAPSFDTIMRLCSAKHVSPEWLETGEGAMLIGADAIELPDDAVRVPLYEVKASAGVASGVAWTEIAATTMIFSREQLRRMSVRPEGAALIKAEGNSNSPVIEDGNLLLIDRSDTEPVDARFVFERNGSIFVKLLQRLGNGGWLLKSDNPAWEPDRLPKDEADQVRILGRVRQVFRAV